MCDQELYSFQRYFYTRVYNLIITKQVHAIFNRYKTHPSSHPEIVPQRKTGLRLSFNHLLQNEELLIFSYFIGRNSSSKWHICKFYDQNKG